MNRRSTRVIGPNCVLVSALVLAPAARALATDPVELEQIRKEMTSMKHEYEQRLEELEARLKKAEEAAHKAEAAAAQSSSSPESATVPNTSASAAPGTAAGTAPATASAGGAPAPASSTVAGSTAFNPNISLILSGQYANLSQNPANYSITGFIPPAPGTQQIGPGQRGFSLSESELGLYANIDPYFYGGAAFAFEPDNTVSTEEAFIQTIGLSNGLTLKAGRFFSGIGYLNEQHAHTWDFVDAPLVYQAFLGTQMAQDGAQLRWLAPLETFVELGTEVGRGQDFPGSDRDKNGVGDWTLFVHTGGDVGPSNSWRAGLSYLATDPQDRQYDTQSLAGRNVTNSFTGHSWLWIADAVWKWAPNGNPYYTNFKLQGEFMWRNEGGNLVFDTTGVGSNGVYSSLQSGWYLQGVYQFHPYWRVGLRKDLLNVGSLDYGPNNPFLTHPDFHPSKLTTMVDFSPSEFSRIRLQFARDQSREGLIDNQIYLQYQMSMGAHGAHTF